MRPRRLAGIFLACSIATAPVTAQAPQPAADEAAEQIASVRARFLDAVRAERLDEIATLFAPDGSMVAGGRGRVTGRETLRDFWGDILARFDADTTLRPVRLESSGDLAYESGDFAETYVSVADGEEHEVEGTYLMVFQRQPAGQWLILEQIWVAATP